MTPAEVHMAEVPPAEASSTVLRFSHVRGAPDIRLCLDHITEQGLDTSGQINTNLGGRRPALEYVSVGADQFGVYQPVRPDPWKARELGDVYTTLEVNVQGVTGDVLGRIVSAFQTRGWNLES